MIVNPNLKHLLLTVIKNSEPKVICSVFDHLLLGYAKTFLISLRRDHSHLIYARVCHIRSGCLIWYDEQLLEFIFRKWRPLIDFDLEAYEKFKGDFEKHFIEKETKQFKGEKMELGVNYAKRKS